MNVLIWQVVIDAATLVVVVLHWRSCCRCGHARERRLVPVPRERRPPVAHVSRIVRMRTVALSTLPMPIRGTLEVAKPGRHAAPSLPLPAELRFPPPDAALMQRVLDGLRALPANPRDRAGPPA